MITVAVLALNEEKFLSKTIDTMLEAAALAGNIPLEIIIVNDGSTDGTAEVIQRLQARHPFIRSIHHAQNQGLGVGARESIKLAKYPKIIFAPGDNDLPKELLTQLFLNINKADLILAYYMNMKQRGWFRNGLSRIYTFIYQRTFNVPIRYINSPCIYPTQGLRSINIRSNRFGFSAEMTIKMLCLGCTFYQVPGYRQLESSPSRSISLKNLNEVADVFLNLVYEIKISGRNIFNHHPVEIFK